MIYKPLKNPSLSNWTNVEQGGSTIRCKFGGKSQKNLIFKNFKIILFLNNIFWPKKINSLMY